MARPAKPWYWKARDAWYVTIQGKRVPLCKGKANKNEAYRRFLELDADQTRAVTARITGKEVCDFYIKHAKANLKPKTHRWYAMYLEPFGKTVAKTDANDVKPKDVTDFINEHPEWNTTTRAGAVTAIKRAWQHAHAEGRITLNHLKPMKKPRALRRDEIIDEREAALFIKAAKPEFRSLLEFIHATGCRPGEAALIERRHVQLHHKEVRFRIGEDKTSGRTGKPRVIHLNETATAILTELMQKGGTGRLFRNSKGNPWTEFSIAIAARKARDRAGLDERAVAYSFRHLWATNALARGVPLAIVAEMMGNSPEIVAKVYSHLSDKKQLLLDAANTVRPSQNAKTATAE